MKGNDEILGNPEYRKYRTSLPLYPKTLPVTEIPVKPKYFGILEEDTVKIRSETDAQELHEGGCFGVSSRFQKQNINEKYYEIRDGFDEDDDDQKGEVTIIGKSKIDEDLTIFLEEAFFLHHSLKALEISDQTGKVINTEEFLQECVRKQPDFITRFVAYHFLRAKKWVVKDGTNFGSDYLLYKLGPQYYHSQYTVKVRKSMDCKGIVPSKEFLGWYRISESSKKECIIIDVVFPESEKEDPMEYIRRLSEFKIEIHNFKRYNLWKGDKNEPQSSTSKTNF